MLRPYLGNIGHAAIIISFVTAIIATYAYWQASRNLTNKNKWTPIARSAFFVHGAALITVVTTLFTIIFNRYFEYHYAWDNSSLSLPLGYAISCFWQDQEGSFLLWMFWNVLVGSVMIWQFARINKKGKGNATDFEAPTMTIFAAVQGFLASMILGVVVFGEMKIGSSPFLLLRESMANSPIFQTNPDFVPKDGNGLNPLLQNYWMVIHPPTLFLGFSLTFVPFAFAMAGLWKKKYTEWVKPALPWTLLATVVLGTGIMMGGIWAYETLNFGGYWNWDPVENAVYVPWLVLVASFHTMLLSKKSSSALKYSIILVVAQFILILYSTFLTRSGILGNASVHSFTDLGLSGQLLIYLLTFVFMSIILMVVRWKHLPKDNKEITTFTPDFWMTTGVILLLLAAFQVTVTTSIPVYNKISELFGGNLNMAMPAEQIEHYTNFQMWFFIVIVALSGIAQFFWWKRIDEKTIGKLLNPLIISLLLSSLIIVFFKVNNWKYILILTTSMFSIVANTNILTDVIKGKWKVAGGAITHIGVALMLLGIMFSSGYSKVISLNNTGQEIFANAEDENKENVILWLNRPTALQDFSLTYTGQFVDVRNVPGYIEKRFIQPIPTSDYKGIARADIMDGEKLFYSRGDTVEYEAENTYYQVSYEGKDKEPFNLYPRFQMNEKMGNVASPDIKKFWNRDVYTHVTFVTVDEDREWGPAEEFNVAMKDTFFLNDYIAILEDVRGVREVDGIKLQAGDAAAIATVRVLERDGEKVLSPSFVIKDREVWSRPVVSSELGLRIQLTRIDPVSGQFSFSVSRGQREFIVLKALEKPQINLLWIGTLLLMVGISIATVRRFRIAKVA
jgi:cytochrome c-type biogenesis protein CcmF